MIAFSDINLVNIPFLIVVDKENIKALNYFEKFRKEISFKYSKDNNFKCNFQFLKFDYEWSLLSLGFIWLCQEMKTLN